MSKSGQMYLELQEKANDLGFETVEDAERNGYTVVGTDLRPTEDVAYEEASRAWVEKKRKIIEGLTKVRLEGFRSEEIAKQVAQETIDFIEKECKGVLG